MDGAMSTEPSVADRVRYLIARQAVLPMADVRPDMTMEQLGLDSLGLVEIIFAIEESFDVSVPFNANEPGNSPFDTATVGAVIAGVEALVARSGA